MNQYLEIITPEIIKQNEHISDDEIRQDIADTKYEIENLGKEHEGWLAQAVTTNMPERRMAYFHADNARHGIDERKKFIAFLEKLLAARQVEQAK